MAAALCAWKSGQGNVAEICGNPAWTNTLPFATLGFISVRLGLQGITGKCVNTQFATTSELHFLCTRTFFALVRSSTCAYRAPSIRIMASLFIPFHAHDHMLTPFLLHPVVPTTI